jgi:hypothetical protein
MNATMSAGADPVRDADTGTWPYAGYEAPRIARHSERVPGEGEPRDRPSEIVAARPAEHGEDDAKCPNSGGVAATRWHNARRRSSPTVGCVSRPRRSASLKP